MSEVHYRVTYYQWCFNRYGDKDYELMDHWVNESILTEMKNDSHVDDLEIVEQKVVVV